MRSRRKDHLEAFLRPPGSRPRKQVPERTPNADYAWRVELCRFDFEFLLSAQVDELDYTNFKGECDRGGDRDYAEALHEVWRVMRDALLPRKRREGGKFGRKAMPEGYLAGDSLTLTPRDDLFLDDLVRRNERG